MEHMLEELRALGVVIPAHLQGEELVSLAKKLCTWTITMGAVGREHYATTRRNAELTKDADASSYLIYGNTRQEAAMKLLLTQLQAGKYSVRDTEYKQTAMEYRRHNP